MWRRLRVARAPARALQGTSTPSPRPRVISRFALSTNCEATAATGGNGLTSSPPKLIRGNCGWKHELSNNATVGR